MCVEPDCAPAALYRLALDLDIRAMSTPPMCGAVDFHPRQTLAFDGKIDYAAHAANVDIEVARAVVDAYFYALKHEAN